jgi:hypothetical protein
MEDLIAKTNRDKSSYVWYGDREAYVFDDEYAHVVRGKETLFVSDDTRNFVARAVEIGLPFIPVNSCYSLVFWLLVSIHESVLLVTSYRVLVVICWLVAGYWCRYRVCWLLVFWLLIAVSKL